MSTVPVDRAPGGAYRLGGRTYPFADDYFAALSRVRPLETVVDLPVYAGAALESHSRKVEDVGFLQFLAKAYEAVLLLEALASVGRRPPYGTVLDIGSGPALQPRILQLAGAIDRLEAIDIYDGTRRCSDRLLRRYARRMRALSVVHRHAPRALIRRIDLLRRMDSKWPVGVEEFGYHPADRVFPARLHRRPTLDAYHVGDIFDHRGRYDLVTSFMALEYFGFDEIAAKVSDLLVPGGLFGFVVSYWWYPVNSSLLYGRFPYLLQQLGADDVVGYYARVHPALPEEGIARRLSYSDAARPTVGEYERLAYRHGLVPLRSMRLHPDHTANPRAVLGPLSIDALPGWRLDTVLDSARRVKPDLGLVDLMTSHVLMLFRRR